MTGDPIKHLSETYRVSVRRHSSDGRLFVYPSEHITDEVRDYVREHRQRILDELDSHGLGDWTEKQLKKIGITQEWYKEVKVKFGLAPTCGCDKRKKWLNSVSSWWNGQ